MEASGLSPSLPFKVHPSPLPLGHSLLCHLLLTLPLVPSLPADPCQSTAALIPSVPQSTSDAWLPCAPRSHRTAGCRGGTSQNKAGSCLQFVSDRLPGPCPQPSLTHPVAASLAHTEMLAYLLVYLFSVTLSKSRWRASLVNRCIARTPDSAGSVLSAQLNNC